MRQAQSTLEYALLIGVVVGGLLTMQNYLKRSVQGKLGAAGDEIGEQYSPGLTNKVDHMVSKIDRIIENTFQGDNGRTQTIITGGHQEQTTHKEIKNLDQETWPTKRIQ
jgi:hypothetical protein